MWPIAAGIPRLVDPTGHERRRGETGMPASSVKLPRMRHPPPRISVVERGALTHVRQRSLQGLEERQFRLDGKEQLIRKVMAEADFHDDTLEREIRHVCGHRVGGNQPTPHPK